MQNILNKKNWIIVGIIIIVVGITSILFFSTAKVKKDDQSVAALVNNKKIYVSDVEKFYNSDPMLASFPLELFYKRILDTLITKKLLEEEAVKKGMGKDPEVLKQLAEIKKGLMMNAYIKSIVEEKITEEEVQKVYKEVVEKQPKQEEVKASHILVKDEKEAKDIIKKLQAGEEFEKLAEEKSADSSSQSGGDLGYFSKEAMVPEFSEAAFKLKVGEYTKSPVKTQFGWHIIKVTDKREKPPVSIDDVREAIKNEIANRIGKEEVDRLRQTAKVKMFDLDGKELDPNAPDPSLPNNGSVTEVDLDKTDEKASGEETESETNKEETKPEEVQTK